MTLDTVSTGHKGSFLVNLQSTFRFWPVSILGVTDGWVYGTYVLREDQPHKVLLRKGLLKSLLKSRGRRQPLTENQSFRRYEDVLTALDSRRILKETAELDEFRFFEPQVFVDEKAAKEAFLEFMNLADQNDDAAVQFMRKFGSFDDLPIENGKLADQNAPGVIRQFCEDCLRKSRSPYVVRLSSFWAVRDEIQGLLSLSVALETGRLVEVQEHCRRRRPHSDYDSHTDWLAVGRAILCADLTSSLNPPDRQNPRLCLAIKDRNLSAVTVGMSVRSALCLTLLEMIVSKTEYRRCLKCQRHFVVRGLAQQYCGRKCKHAATMRRSRAKNRKKKNSRRTKRKGKPQFSIKKTRHAGALTPTRR